MSKFSVKKPYTVFVAVVICLILGVVSFTRMSTDLLPEFSLPYVVVVTTYPGASPDKVESTVTEPLESGLGTVNGVRMSPVPPMRITVRLCWNLQRRRTWIVPWSNCPMHWI